MSHHRRQIRTLLEPRQFPFPHKLAGHPLFELDSLVELSRRMPNCADFAYWSNGTEDPGNQWGARGKSLSLQDTIAGIADNNSLVLIKHTWHDEVYGPVLQSCLSEAVKLCGVIMHNDVILGNATILIASPNRVTPYHSDWDATSWRKSQATKSCMCSMARIARYLRRSSSSAFAPGISIAPYTSRRGKRTRRYDGVHIPYRAALGAKRRQHLGGVQHELRAPLGKPQFGHLPGSTLGAPRRPPSP
jgi:hypothetical protein